MRNMEFDEICAILEQKPPFVFVDRVVELEFGKSIVTEKNVTGTEYFSSCHFPQKAVFPGVFLIETAAQSACLLCGLSAEEDKMKGTMVLAGVQRFSFIKTVKPGDRLRVSVNLIKLLPQASIVTADISVDGKPVASGQLTFGVIK
jgi:3-hydroxyacyl-[acyl-carrier-protein] dehydratase